MDNMIFLILGGIIGLLLLVSYIRTINRNMKLQSKVIEEQKDVIERERIAHKYTKAQLDIYVQSYHQAVDRLHELAGMKVETQIKVTEFDMDEILNEIVNKDWDKVPPTEYFNELMRVSKNQIIWGGNYFNLPPTRCFIVWDKIISDDFSLAMAELAWTSFDKLAKIIKLQVPKDGKIHPTQKPSKLYAKLLRDYTTENFKILDTHFGSGSIALAVDKANRLDKMNLHLTACEIDKEYIDKAIKRISESIKQGTLSF
jgi:hypothetical protein